MLVFSRREMEVSVIDLWPLLETLGVTRQQLADVGFDGDPIVTVRPVEVRRHAGLCRLGFEANPLIKLHRLETYDAIQADARAAAQAAAVPTPIEQAVAAAMPTVEERAAKRAKRIRGEKGAKAS